MFSTCGMGRRNGGITHGQHDDTTDEQLAKRGSVTHLKATGLGDSLCQFWFSIQSQKNIGHIWGRRLEQKLRGGRSEGREGSISSITSLD